MTAGAFECSQVLTPTAWYGTYSTVHTALLLSEDVHTNSSNACGVIERECSWLWLGGQAAASSTLLRCMLVL
jgi:hypothetical protein